MRREEFNIYEFHENLKKQFYDSLPSSVGLNLSEIKEKLEDDLTYKEEHDFRYMLVEINKADMMMTDELFFHMISPVVQEFKELLNQTIKESFVRYKKNNSAISSDHKLALIERYIQTIEQYPNLASHLPNFTQTKNTNLCEDCNVELNETNQTNLVCPYCGREYPYFYQDGNTSSGQLEQFCYKDLSRINTNMKYSYIRQTHFKDTLKQFQGKQNKFIHPSVYDTLKKSFEDVGLGETNKNGKFTKITKDHIKMFLQENSLYKYYEDINLIYSELTGIPCPNISEYEKTLIEDFDNLVIAYDKVITSNPEKYNRSNFLNSYYILYQLLKRRGYACKESDFPLIKTIDRKIEHDEIYEECCKLLGWFYIATV